MQIIDAEGYLRRQEQPTAPLPDVSSLIRDVQINGDDAVRRYTRQFDGKNCSFREIPQKEFTSSCASVDGKTVDAIRSAARRIEAFARRQAESLAPFEMKERGMRLGQTLIPLRRVGCYVPGGRYPLPSTALMTVIPAKVAGVDEVIVCSPGIGPVTITAAAIAGADRIFSVGGVQAIGAMAYGTGTIPRVDKIVGPGNSYVTAAKKAVFGDVGIDMLAGPSEVLVIADGSCDPSLVAADLLAQAEHDPQARAGVITFSTDLASRIREEVYRLMQGLDTAQVARQSINRSTIIIAADADEAVRLADRMAPEHLELQVRDSSWYEQRLRDYGSLFIGRYAAEALGDYCSGPNHTLPTAGAARYTGGLSPLDFMKVVTYQEIDAEGARSLAPVAERMAAMEGLDGHAQAAAMRRDG